MNELITAIPTGITAFIATNKIPAEVVKLSFK